VDAFAAAVASDLVRVLTLALVGVVSWNAKELTREVRELRHKMEGRQGINERLVRLETHNGISEV